MRNFLLRLFINAVAIYGTVLFVPGIGFGDGGVSIEALVLTALIFGAVNAVIKPLVRLFTCPIYVLTLGLFTLFVNGSLLLLTAWIARQFGSSFRVESFLSAVLGGILISAISLVLSIFLDGKRQPRKRRSER